MALLQEAQQRIESWRASGQELIYSRDGHRGRITAIEYLKHYEAINYVVMDNAVILVDWPALLLWNGQGRLAGLTYPELLDVRETEREA